MMVCEVLLDRIEELRIGLPGELRPALAVGDPQVPFAGRGGLPRLYGQRFLLRPAEIRR